MSTTNEAKRLNKSIAHNEGSEQQRSGSLKRNNVYTAAAVQDWAGRIRSGPGGIKMNQKFMLVAMSMSCNPRGICELPVRYLADYIGVGIRQAQRIIASLARYELITCLGVAPQGRPNDIVRKFILNTTIDADTWSPIESTSYATLRKQFTDHLQKMLAAHEISDLDFVLLSKAFLLVVRSKQLDFVSPDAEVTNAVWRFRPMILEIASKFSGTPVLKIHLRPRSGYRN